MKKNILKFSIYILLFIAGIGFLTCKIGPLPALGSFFSPYYGIWPHFKETKIQPVVQSSKVTEKADVFFDDRKVPHIFSKNKESLYHAFGYVTAQNRLFQMYLTARAAEGRVSEIVGSVALPFDKMMREINFKATSEKMIKDAYDEPELKSYVLAYVNGVNDYIKSLTPQTMPWEFVFFDVPLPEWRLLDTTLIYQNINWEMTKTTTARSYSSLINKADLNHLLELFPYISSLTVPIFPGTPSLSQDKIISSQNKKVVLQDDIALSSYDIPNTPLNGSNNWVLSGAKTKNGYPMLANDPHLNLTLPSVWYEAQLSSGDLNVYGVTLPGIPFLAIGFNKDIAWGITNGSDNSIEYYSVKTQANKSGEKEYYNGETWLPLPYRTEEILIKNKAPLHYKVYQTPHGNISNLDGRSFDNSIPQSSIMRWSSGNDGKEFKAFYQINKAKNYVDFVSAISLHVSPSFNFAFAARNGDIALWHQGKFIERKQPEPIFVQDYSQLERMKNEEHERFISTKNNPHSLNPKSNYIYSANQEPVSLSYPYYFPGKYESYSRPNRINDVLKNLTQATPEDMMRLQNDNMSLYAKDFLNKFFQIKFSESEFSVEEKEIFSLLKNWDYIYTSNSKAATFFEEWQASLKRKLWTPLFLDKNKRFMTLPSYERNLEYFKQPDTKLWFTAQKLKEQLTYRQILLTSFKETFQILIKRYGFPINKNWELRSAFPLNIPNLAKLPGFGEEHLSIGGSKYSPNAIEYSPSAHGPSWRMIVSFKKEGLDAWGVFPGGASGNPADINYTEGVSSWAKGEYYPLVFMQEKPSLAAAITIVNEKN